MEEFSSNTVCAIRYGPNLDFIPQNSKIDDWMSFPVIRSGSCPGNSPINVVWKQTLETLTIGNIKIYLKSIVKKWNVSNLQTMFTIWYCHLTICQYQMNVSKLISMFPFWSVIKRTLWRHFSSNRSIAGIIISAEYMKSWGANKYLG